MGGIADTVGGLVGGLTGYGGAQAAGKATDAQLEAIKQAISEYNSGYAGQQALFNPYAQAGTQGLQHLNALNSGDFSAFESSPDFLFAQQQGNQALGQQQASRGNLFSGGAGRELAQFNQGLASNQLGQYRNSLMGQIGIGQYGTNGLSNALTNKTQGIADARIGAGQARASGYTGAAGSYSNAAANWMNMASSLWGGGGPASSNTPSVTSNTGGGLLNWGAGTGGGPL